MWSQIEIFLDFFLPAHLQDSLMLQFTPICSFSRTFCSFTRTLFLSFLKIFSSIMYPKPCYPFDLLSLFLVTVAVSDMGSIRLRLDFLSLLLSVTLSRTLSYIYGRSLIWTHIEDLIGRTRECLIWLQEMHKGQLGHRDKEKFRLEGHLSQEHWHVDLYLTTADRLSASMIHGMWLPTALNSHIPWFSSPCYRWSQFC